MHQQQQQHQHKHQRDRNDNLARLVGCAWAARTHFHVHALSQLSVSATIYSLLRAHIGKVVQFIGAPAARSCNRAVVQRVQLHNRTPKHTEYMAACVYDCL